MRKIYPLLAACALCTAAIAQDASKYSEVTGTYLKNTDFETAPITFLTTTVNEEAGTATPVGTKDVQVYDIPNWTRVMTEGQYPRYATAKYGIEFPTKGDGSLEIPDLLNGVAVATDAAGNADGAYLAITCGWGSQVKLGQEVTLPKGSYFLTYEAYNIGSGLTPTENYFGFEPESGNARHSTCPYYTEKTWMTDTVYFNVEADNTKGNIILGFKGIGVSSAQEVRLAIDNVKLYYTSEMQTLPDTPVEPETEYFVPDANTVYRFQNSGGQNQLLTVYEGGIRLNHSGNEDLGEENQFFQFVAVDGEDDTYGILSYSLRQYLALTDDPDNTWTGVFINSMTEDRALFKLELVPGTTNSVYVQLQSTSKYVGPNDWETGPQKGVYMDKDAVPASKWTMLTAEGVEPITPPTGEDTGVASLGASQVEVYAHDGRIVVEGADAFKVYSVTGAEVNAENALGAGLYIVTANGESHKVLVK